MIDVESAFPDDPEPTEAPSPVPGATYDPEPRAMVWVSVLSGLLIVVSAIVVGLLLAVAIGR